ncbi:metal-dependent protein hydrolase [Coemansia reversa NRRL 1564]|uniref:Metal-dependent protein hydrolase n=1 Tax=Coemansia reversa (strain ATCC 12441 / NRRL 1564) TaxID=763665 RepID=A0A2G5BIS4_COERN|nr:metal-dependent protein hydrolase [Coemansia reversa NRRL 1564]|eukprot:PIA18889.1 metal-dependent protein hydrolase [Coemansia reversa NRRL 1564]
MPKIIGTHSGTFHCDEALACFMLRQLDEYSDAKIVRSRDPAVLDTCDIVVDVGGVYDHDTKRYDHHQRGFDEQFSTDYKTKLSSAGLIYKHYGKDVIRSIAKDAHLSEDEVDQLFDRLYKVFVEGIDGNDNGISRYPEEIDPFYLDNTGLPARVSRLNPWWNEPEGDMDERFTKAVALTGSEFSERVRYHALAWLPGRKLVERAYQSRFDIDSSGKIVLFDQFCPWKDNLSIIEDEALEKNPELAKIIYVLYADTAGSWRVQSVPEKPGSFKSRHPLPEAWRGVRDDALSERSGIEGCIFVHQSGFIGGNKTRDGALELARKALTMD